MKIKVGLSNHHIHVTKEAFEILFGKDSNMHVRRELSQKGEFACEETVTIKNGDNYIDNVRIIGPFRKYVQVELLESDKDTLNINPPYRNSGDLKNSETVTIIGPSGEYYAKESTIIANNHIHMSSEDINSINKKQYDVVNVITKDGIVIKDLIIKSDPSCVLEMHLNKDDGIKYNLENKDEVELC